MFEDRGWLAEALEKNAPSSSELGKRALVFFRHGGENEVAQQDCCLKGNEDVP